MNNKIIKKITSGALLCTMLTYATPILAFTKDETVYTKLDSNGSNYNTIVSNHIENENQEKLINDISDLLNIKNVNGDEEFTQDGNSLVWNAEGSDIYYQGETQKELPIECKIKYELDGNEITPQELAGKSGKVKITIEYVNKDSHTVKINGKDETIYTPFVVVCGTIINNENNRNIEITNGKAIDDGSKTTVVGIALPGLQESLGISKDKIEVPNTIEITMEATEFELNNIVTYVTPKVIEDTDLELFDSIDEIYSKIDTLQTSSKQLEDGANTLKDGTNTYSEKTQEFNNAMQQVSNGVNSAAESYSKIDDGIEALSKNSVTLQSGAKSISDGTEAVSENLQVISGKLGELQAGTQSLQAGEKQISDGLDTIIKSLNGITITDNSEKVSELTKLLQTNKNTINVLKNTNKELESQLAIADETAIVTIKTQIATNNSMIELLEANVKANEEIIASLKQTDLTAIKTLQAGLNSIQSGMKELQAGTDTLYNGQEALKDGTDTLAAKTEELSQGAKTLYKGTTAISQGTKTLNAGSSEMKKGLNTLNTGAGQLSEASNQLTEGASTISEGATTLADGISKFNREGIQTICNYINGDLKDVTTRLEKLQSLSEEYNNFTMLNDGDNGNVKFIMIVDNIKKEEDSKQEAIIEEKNKKEE